MGHAIRNIFQKLGGVMHRHARVIQAIQWSVVLIYAVLLIIPAFMHLPPRQAHILDNLVLFAQFVFWGIWWPFVILSMLFMGRLWCGVFCPEGCLSEWTSRKFGMNKTIPRWLKWRGWPAVAFVLTTLYGQLISVYDYAEAALLILGGSTVAAMGIGLFFGRGTRVWCRYLCPVSGVFNLLSRLAPISFKTDNAKWDQYKGPHPDNPHCPPMINFHQLHGVSACHMCARCAGFRDAIALEPRSPNQEVLDYGHERSNKWETRLLLFGMIGVAIGAFTWTVSPWFVTYKQALAAWLVNHDIFWPLNPTAPWWILTNYPANNDSFNWVDGFCVTTYILGSGVFFGLLLSAVLWLIDKLAHNPKGFRQHLAQAYIPVAAAGLFLGLTATTVKLLLYERITFWWLSDLRAFILIATGLWSFYFAIRIIMRYPMPRLIGVLNIALFACSLIPILYAWWLMFWGW